LIDSDLIEKIKYARTKGNIRNIKVSTNGILLEKVGKEKMLESGIDSILINIGGMDSKTYTRLFGMDAFCVVYENIKNLLALNKSKGNKVDLNVVIKIISTMGILQNRNYQGLSEISRMCNAKIIFDSTYDSWGGRISNDNMIGEMKLKGSKEKKEPCCLLFFTLTVTWNGDVVPCCRDIDGEIVLGNIMEQSIDEIWRGDRIKDLRKSFTEGNIPPMCSRCGHYEGLKPLKSFHLLKQTLKRRGCLKRSKFTQEKAKKEQETF
jgi:radical SAM protein with 4Fe4S-binding SPASM domain